jgi:hypothetical protein
MPPDRCASWTLTVTYLGKRVYADTLTLSTRSRVRALAYALSLVFLTHAPALARRHTLSRSPVHALY